MMRYLLALFLTLSLSSCWMVRAFRIRHMRLTDHRKLPSVPIATSDSPYHFINSAAQPQYGELATYLDKELDDTRTAAFLVIRNDSIIYERYFDGFTGNEILPSNSMAKSFTGTLVGIALAEGKIRSLQEPMTNYIPELLDRDSAFARITIQHLLDMRSGFQFNEGSYDLKDDAIRLGLRPRLKKNLLKIRIAEPPGRFRYQSVNTQFLGWIIERATGKKLSAYLEEKLWKPMGMEGGATWNVDSKKTKRELASAGLNALPRDFAKLGQLYLNHGEWRGQQLLPSSWVQSIAPMDTMEQYGGYRKQWWGRPLTMEFDDSTEAAKYRATLSAPSAIRKVQNDYRVSYRTPGYSAIGFLSQFIYVNPTKNLVIVRLGRRWRHSDVHATGFVYRLGERL